jgi:arylformamidase
MTPYPISDWDDAYANAPHIPEGSAYPGRWAERASAFRQELTRAGRARIDFAYGPGSRNKLDLFYPEGRRKGLVVFVHGGYWKAFDKSCWSHLAHGALASGHVVAMPSYSLCPDVRVSTITKEVAAAIECAAKEVDGGIFLCGHSAGGHLAARMVCRSSPLSDQTAARIVRTVSIAGLHDLRPLIATKMNEILGLDWEEARLESPALLEPRPRQTVACWVGADERPEFIRQSRILGDMWSGFDARTTIMEEPHRHHFNVIDGLTEPDHPLIKALLGD